MALVNDLLGGDDIDSIDLNTAETEMASHGAPPEGVYHAVLDVAKPHTFNSGTTIQKLKFKIIGGPYAGKTVEEELWPPANETDAEKKKKKIARNAIFMHRLGLVRKVKDPSTGKDKTEPVPGKRDLGDCVGTVCFIDVKHKEEEYTKDGRKIKFTKAVLAFEGILSPDDKRVKDVPKGTAPKPSDPSGPNGASGTSGGGTKKPDYSDI